MANKNKNNEDKGNSKYLIIALTLILVLLLGVTAIIGYKHYNEKEDKELAYTELINSINEEKIEKIKMTTGSNSLTVTYRGEGKEEERQKTV